MKDDLKNLKTKAIELMVLALEKMNIDKSPNDIKHDALHLVKRFFYIPVFLFISVVLYFMAVGHDSHRSLETHSYQEFIASANAGEIQEVSINKWKDNRVLVVVPKEGTEYRTIYFSEENLQTINDLGIPISEDFRVARDSDVAYVVMGAVLYTGIVVIIVFVMGGVGKDSESDKVHTDKEVVRFDDVLGVDEAKFEFKEIVDIFKNPNHYIDNGVVPPRGVLLEGPPGTGKTLMAKAAAYESGATFFALSGSDFVQMWVGLGALRVRRVFSKARKNAPTVIFIDEIDALCGSRGESGANKEHKTTTNALLAEMDGFKKNDNILVIGATNFPESLDEAVLRPGRFDRKIYVGKPSVKGRKELFDLYLKKVKAARNINSQSLAHSTMGFSAAQIAAIVNESAILATRDKKEQVHMRHLEAARDRVLMGYENKSRVMSDKEREIAAVHESGHCLVTYYGSERHYVDKISIISRGAMAGYTMMLEKADFVFTSRKEVLEKIQVLLGGRLAELFYFGADHVTTGAEADFKEATELAEASVMHWGFSGFGFRYVEGKPEKFMALSETQKTEIDAEVKLLLEKCTEKAFNVIEKHKKELEELTQALLAKETLSKKTIENILNDDNRSG